MKPSDYFKKTGTDKGAYTIFYDMAIPLLTTMNGSIRVLEIGCTFMLNQYGTGSSNAFSEMPFVEKYVGIDIIPPKHDFGEKATFIQGDAYTPKMVEKVASLSAGYDLIIDDGPHGWRNQVKFFELYERLCAPKSIIVCEDVSTLQIYTCFEKIDDRKLCLFASENKRDKIFGRDKNLLVKFNI